MSEVNRIAEQVTHPFLPVFDRRSRVLVLGTMPSRQSRNQGFYYGHPQNRFWAVLAGLLRQPLPPGPAERRLFLLDNRIALWDVLQQCTINGSSDSSIRIPVANDLASLLEAAPIQRIFANGQTAASLYRNLCEASTGRPCTVLPSTSSANGRFDLAGLLLAWQPVVNALLDDSGKSTI